MMTHVTLVYVKYAIHVRIGSLQELPFTTTGQNKKQQEPNARDILAG